MSSKINFKVNSLYLFVRSFFLMDYYRSSIKDVLKELNTSETGISSAEAVVRLQKFGLNELKEAVRPSVVWLFLSQFSSPLVWILLFAVVFSAVVGEVVDAYVIVVIVFLNAVLGFVQEYRAEVAVLSLRKLTAPRAKVWRDGVLVEVPARELVPGDVVELEVGSRASADCRLLSVSNLATQEAALSGESVPVVKDVSVIKGHVGVADQRNMVFAGTVVVDGRGVGVVVATGMLSQVGRIAGLLQSVKVPLTPLQVQLKNLAVQICFVVLAVSILVFALGSLQRGDLFVLLLSAIALAVAAIPEGLPAVVTIALSFGVRSLARHGAFVRSLPSVETLGACSVICVDKTGTLTRNEMTVQKLFVNGEVVSVSGEGFVPKGGFSKDPDGFRFLLEMGVLNNHARLHSSGGDVEVVGDPTEAALLVLAQKADIDVDGLIHKSPLLLEVPFSSERKRMTTVHDLSGKKLALTKGAPEVVLARCSRILIRDKIVALTPAMRKRILDVNASFASDALRNLGFAFSQFSGGKPSEENMIFVGLAGMIDPPRAEVKEAVAVCQRAGVRVVMITGDHVGTALAVANELNIRGKALTGVELDHIANLADVVEDVGVYARVNPLHKLKIVEALKARGHVIAMTGDGVNDAPALKSADLGIAMGLSGTDVAKDASGMVLADDNFATIVRAVREGRRIFDNIRKFVEYLLSSNMGEVLVVLGAMIAGLRLPVLAIHLLWINLVTDGFPALALSKEPAERNVMERAPRRAGEVVVDFERGLLIVLVGVVMMVGTLGIFVYSDGFDYVYGQTMAFTTLVFFQMFNVLNQRSDRSVFSLSLLSNPFLLLSIVVSVGLQLLLVSVPSLASFFSIATLSLFDVFLCVVVSSSVLWAVEVWKMVVKR